MIIQRNIYVKFRYIMLYFKKIFNLSNKKQKIIDGLTHRGIFVKLLDNAI